MGRHCPRRFREGDESDDRPAGDDTARLRRVVLAAKRCIAILYSESIILLSLEHHRSYCVARSNSLPFCILFFFGGHIVLVYPALLPSDKQAVLTINKTTDSTLTMKFRGTDRQSLQWINTVPCAHYFYYSTE